MNDTIFIILLLLFLKHWFVDFIDQTQREVDEKGYYGKLYGIFHSIKHAWLTTLILLFYYPSSAIPYIFGAIDFIIHYHVDWAKMKIGRTKNYGIQDKMFWVLIGSDQLLHSLTYLGIAKYLANL
jgi:Protein of unknown function (DUF3307)